MVPGSDHFNNPLQQWGKVVQINGSFTKLTLSCCMTLNKLIIKPQSSHL